MLPPGPRGLPILGVLSAVRRNPTGVFMSAARRFGHVAYLKIGPQRGYLITNPADVRHVLQDNARNHHKSPLYDKLRWPLITLRPRGMPMIIERRVAWRSPVADRARPLHA
jgi:cytochrome P450